MSNEPLHVEPRERLGSLDAYRGLIMLLMVSGGFGFTQVAGQLPDSGFWQWLGFQFSHVPWQVDEMMPGGDRLIGLLGLDINHIPWPTCTPWDLIQPSFMFMVGVSMPFSYARRTERGHSWFQSFRHAVVRSFILVALGVFLSSAGSRQTQTNFVFPNVLCQIGLGYTFLFLFWGRGRILQILGLIAILAGYWYWFYTYPTPGPDFDYASVGVGENVTIYSGLFAHWNMNANAAAGFDQWFLNLFPRAQAFKFNAGGYQTLNFIPSLATMLLGLMAGGLLYRQDLEKASKFRRLVLAGVLCVAAGTAAGYYLCPNVKRIWTPSWAVFSAGWAFLMLAAFYWIVDIKEHRRWTFPFVVVGMNSIAMYVMAQLMKPFTWKNLNTHFGWILDRLQTAFSGPLEWLRGALPSGFSERLFDGVYMPIFHQVAVLFALWVVCWWLYRQRLFVRI